MQTPSRSSLYQPSQPSKLSSPTITGLPSPVTTSRKFTAGSQDFFSSLSTSSAPKPLSPPISKLAPPVNQPAKPNYNISLGSFLPTTSTSSQYPVNQSTFEPSTSTFLPLQPSTPSLSPSLSPPITPSHMPSMGGILVPSRPMQSSLNTPKKSSQNDWGDFDPLL